MGIKLKNCDKDSSLKKLYLNLQIINVSNTVGSPLSLSAGMIANAIVPVAGNLNKIIVSTDTDITASNGYTVLVVNGQKSASLVNQTFHSQGNNALGGTSGVDWTANGVLQATATNTTSFSAGSHLEFRISGSVGAARIFAMAVIDIDSREEK